MKKTEVLAEWYFPLDWGEGLSPVCFILSSAPEPLKLAEVGTLQGSPDCCALMGTKANALCSQWLWGRVETLYRNTPTERKPVPSCVDGSQ